MTHWTLLSNWGTLIRCAELLGEELEDRCEHLLQRICEALYVGSEISVLVRFGLKFREISLKFQYN